MSLQIQAQATLELLRLRGAYIPREERYRAFQRRYYDDPAAFLRECIEWDGPTSYQVDCARALAAHRRVCIRSPHGVGKTALAALLVIWFALTRDGQDWKIIVTAGAWRQVIHYLWPEIHKWAARLRWERIGRVPFREGIELLQHNLKLSTGAAASVVSDRAELIEGAHADHLLYVFDESKSISSEVFDSAEGAFASGKAQEAMALAISTPGEPSGRFWEIQSHKPGYEDWWVRHITFEEALAAGRITEEWRAQRERAWDRNSALYQNRVLGEFAIQREGAIIPLAWVEMANERWLEWQAQGFPGRLTSVGVDVGTAAEGDTQHDEAVAAEVWDYVKVRRLHREMVGDAAVSTVQVEQHVMGILGNPGDRVPCFPDTVGIGLGLGQHLRARGYNVLDFVASYRTELKDMDGALGFVNWRSAAWMMVRELLDPANEIPVCLPPDDKLIGELCMVQGKPNNRSQHEVESKDETRRRLGRSPDTADAVIMALTGPRLWMERLEGERTGYVTYEPEVM